MMAKQTMQKTPIITATAMNEIVEEDKALESVVTVITDCFVVASFWLTIIPKAMRLKGKESDLTFK